MSLLGGDMAAAFGEIFGGEFLPGQLLPYTLGQTPNTAALTETPGDPIPCSYQPERTTQRMREREGYTDKDRRYLVLQAGTGGAQLTTDWDVVDQAGVAWSVVAVNAIDPAGAYWDLHTRPSRRPAPDPEP